MSFVPRRVTEITPMKGDGDPDVAETPKVDEMQSEYILPRRVSELTPLRSDSDEEDGEENNLNCARRLTNSDFLSPTNSDNDSPMRRLPVTPPIRIQSPNADQNENNQNKLNYETPSSVSLPKESLNKLSADNPDETCFLKRPRIPPNSMPPPSRFKQAFSEIVQPKKSAGLSIFKNIKPTVTTNVTTTNTLSFQQNRPIPSVNVMAPSNRPKPTLPSQPVTAAASKEESTPQNDAKNFKTPSVEYTSQRPRGLSRYPPTSSKTKAELKNEFQSNEVLFTTPNTVSSRPMNLPKDANIDLSMNDSISGLAPLSSLKMSSTLDLSSSESRSPSPNKVLHINGKKYIIEKKIGSGGSSSVYLTCLHGTKNQVAVKVVDLQAEPSVVTGYMNETKLLARLQGDDSVIRLFEYDHVPANSILYMVMECGDTDLHHVLQSHNGRFPLYLLMLYWHQMLTCVDYIHRKGVIHSDLKPANFLLVNGRLKLIDFGIASSIAFDSTSIIKFSQAGTFNYISPEALIDTSTGNSPVSNKNQPKIKISTKSDVWSLGCMLYLFLYGKTPFQHIKNICTKAVTITNPNTEVAYSELPDIYPAIYLKVLRRCLVYDTKKRASVQELLQSPYDMIAPDPKR